MINQSKKHIESFIELISLTYEKCTFIDWEGDVGFYSPLVLSGMWRIFFFYFFLAGVPGMPRYDSTGSGRMFPVRATALG
jgi:hypothetical protein